ncbi:MAG TPA: cytochrome c peroxidase [Gemmatimonadaceae bacterium]
MITRLFAVAVLLSIAASAQSPFHARPERVPTGKFSGETSHSGLMGATFSPDARLLLAGHVPDSQFQYGWILVSLRPEAVTTNSQGIAEFPSSAGSNGPWSIAVPLEAFIAAPSSGRHHTPKTQFVKKGVSMCPDPNFADRPCPFPSGQNGSPGDPNTSGGTHDTYQMLVFGNDVWGPEHTTLDSAVDTSPDNDFDHPTFANVGLGVTVNPIGMRRLQVTVANPRSSGAVPVHWVLKEFDVLLWESSVGPTPILGIEPSISHDGRLLLFQGNVSNQTRPWNAADTEGNQIMYSFNETPGVRTGWTMPRLINKMHLEGPDFARKYPIAAQPLTEADGTPLTDTFEGAYPWMTLDATDVVFSATEGINPPDSRRRGMCIVGRSTGYGVRYIDGPLNPDRDATLRIITTGTGHAPGIWSWGGATPDLKIPYTRLGTTIQLLHAQVREMGEICVDEVDGDYLLAWDANEFMKKMPWPTGWQLDKGRTPDTSGNCITGTLSSQARFPQEVTAGADDSMTGASGQRIDCTGAGSISATDARLNARFGKFSASIWFGHVNISNGQDFSLIDKPGAFSLVADAQGRVRASVNTTSGVLQSPTPLGTQLASTWRHAAMTYDGDVDGGARLRVYIDGTLVDEQVGQPGTMSASPDPLQVGPSGIAVSGDPPDGEVSVDQVRLSSVERTGDEIARQAFAAPSPSGLQTLPRGLPLGLDNRETTVPTNNVPTRLAIDLGEVLFHDPAFSPQGNVSCSTCHDSGQFFTDGIDERPGFATGLLLRNSPTVLNRLFSTKQFWDGRADDLESQVLSPLLNPEEIGSTLADIDAVINSATYTQLFQAAYGAAPSLDLMQKALASYERALVSGSSAVDSYESGVPGALTASQKRGRDLFLGKARCFGCHSGSNYSDERFHVTVLGTLGTNDLGRYGVTARERDRRRFKTPTLRNLPQTGPYMHRGQQTSLSGVIQLYDQGGNPPFDPEIFPLGLTAQEKQDLEDFLNALTGGWVKL